MIKKIIALFWMLVIGFLAYVLMLYNIGPALTTFFKFITRATII